MHFYSFAGAKTRDLNLPRRSQPAKGRPSCHREAFKRRVKTPLLEIGRTKIYPNLGIPYRSLPKEFLIYSKLDSCHEFGGFNTNLGGFAF